MKEIKFLKNAEEYLAAMKKESPPWLAKLRQQQWQRFLEQGIPTTKNEEWRYTNLSPLQKHRFDVSSSSAESLQGKNLISHHIYGEVSLVFLDGIFSPQSSNLSVLPQGIIISPIEAIFQNNTDPQLLRSFQETFKEDTDIITMLNTSLFRSGAIIQIPDNLICAFPIHIRHITTGNANATANFPRVFIILGKSAEAQIMESYFSSGNHVHLTDGVTDIILSENAKLTYVKVQKENACSYHLDSCRATLNGNSVLNAFSLELGSQLARHNFVATLNQEGGSIRLNGLYAIGKKQHVDNHTTIYHNVPHCTSSQLYKGLLTENAHGVFKGRIFVHREAQKTNAYQLNKNLLLSRTAQIDTTPQLEISADDVKCSHGATIGPLNPDEVFYLQSRGIPKPSAIKMLARGFAQDILNAISQTTIRDYLNNLVEDFFKSILE